MPRPDPVPELKRQVAQALVAKLDGWSQDNAAFLVGSDQPRISNLRNGRLDRFSLEQLVRFTIRLGGTVTLEVAWTPRRFARVTPPSKRAVWPARRRATCL